MGKGQILLENISKAQWYVDAQTGVLSSGYENKSPKVRIEQANLLSQYAMKLEIAKKEYDDFLKENSTFIKVKKLFSFLSFLKQKVH